jgi:hypothetical protein
VDAPGDAHHAFGVQAALQPVQVPEVPLQAVPDMVGQAALLVGGGLQDAVGGEPGDEMLAQIRGEVGVTLVTEGLHRAHDRGRVDAIAPGQGARGEEEGLVGVLQRGLQQAPPVRRQPALEAGDPFLDGRAGRNAGFPSSNAAPRQGARR